MYKSLTVNHRLGMNVTSSLVGEEEDEGEEGEEEERERELCIICK